MIEYYYKQENIEMAFNIKRKTEKLKLKSIDIELEFKSPEIEDIFIIIEQDDTVINRIGQNVDTSDNLKFFLSLLKECPFLVNEIAARCIINEELQDIDKVHLISILSLQDKIDILEAVFKLSFDNLEAMNARFDNLIEVIIEFLRLYNIYTQSK